VTCVPMRISAPVLTCGMKIGDIVTYEGRPYVLRGLEPMSVPNRRAELEHAETGELVSVPLDEVSVRDP
jgi:hypothetical protein